MRGLRRILFAALMTFVIAAPAWAQATLSGVIKDTSGAVLPGVTVEASSPVLIEKARTALSDGTGRYQIIDLRPGAYEVTFTLTGFATVKRSAVALTGTLTTTVDAEMRVGNVSETVTVTGETAVVDIQSTTRQTVMDQAIVTAIPTSRNSFAVGTLIPGVTVSDGFNSFSDVGGSLGPTTLALMVHGSRVSDQRLLVNGVALSTMIGGGWGGGAVPNATGTSEFAIDTSGVDATAATGGVRINFIPRDGGNKFSGTIFGSYATEGFASDNYTGTDLASRGLTAPGKIKLNGDFNPGFGGPLVKDKLWFFLSARYQAADLYVPGMFMNKNANDPNAWTYVADPTRQAVAPRRFQVYQGRLTLQANPKNKFGVTYDLESNCFCPDNVSATRSPEAGTDRRFPLQRFVQVDWNSPVSSRILIEASAIHRVERWGGMNLQTGNGGNISSLNPAMIGVVDSGTGLTYRAAAQGLGPGSPPYNNSWNKNLHYRASLSYIPGSHVIKLGFNNAWGYFDDNPYTNALPYFYNFLNGNPQSITIQAAPYVQKVEVDRDLGFFIQDKWTTKRWTLSGGIRYDQFKNSFPEQTLGPTFFTPNRNASFPTIENLNWKDITPKLGATWDVFGDGKTAMKVTLNKYLLGYGTLGLGENQISSSPNPIGRLVNNTTRSWTDNGANGGKAGDFIPQCNLQNFNQNGECGPTDQPNFGTIIPGTSYDPNLMTGWGNRQYNWEFSLGVQRELLPRVSIDVSYFRRWYGNFQTMDDRAVGLADYTKFTFKAPTDSRLPGGGGYTQTAYDLQPTNWFLAQDNFVTKADNFGTQTEHWNGVDVNVVARPRAGFIIQGGFSTGRLVTDDCEVAAKLPETLHSFFGSNTRLPFFAARTVEDCHADQGFTTQVKGLAAYTIPKIDLQISGAYQTLPGIVVAANYLAFDTGTLGRPYATFLPFRTFQIVNPGDIYGERMQQLDFRLAKIIKVGSTRTNINFDFYNLFNANTVQSENFTYSPFPPNPWRTPQSILQARFFKFGAQFDF